MSRAMFLFCQILFVMAQNTTKYYLLFGIQLSIMDLQIPRSKLLLASALVSANYILPQYLTLLFAPGFYAEFENLVYSFFMLVNPFAMLLDYWVIRKVLGFSPIRSNISLRHLIMMHYMVALLYWMCNDALRSVFGAIEIAPIFFAHEIVSMLLTTGILWICFRVIRSYVNRTKDYLLIPPELAGKNERGLLIKTIGLLSAVYLSIYIFRIMFFTGIADSGTVTTDFIYLLLLMGVGLCELYNISQVRIMTQNWEMRATGTYISSLLHVNQEFRKIKHDFYNVLQAYGGYLTIQDYEGLKKYHGQLFQTTTAAGDFLSLIETLKNRIAVYGLLEAKAAKAEQMNVAFSINSVCDISQVALSDFNLCRVLGIVIDNALEEAAESEARQVNLSFECKDHETVVFVISNTTQGDVDLTQIFNKGYTTKPGHSGIGLPQVKHILNAYEHCSTRVNYHDQQFTLFLILAVNQKAQGVAEDAAQPLAEPAKSPLDRANIRL